MQKMKAIKELEYKSGVLALMGLLVTKFCCILPLFGSFLGSSIMFSQAKYLTIALCILSMSIIIFSWYRFLKAKNVCECNKRPRKGNRLAISTAFVVVMIIINLNSLLVDFYTKEKNEINNNIIECKHIK